MSALARVLVAKIVLTAGAWCLPLLAFPSALLTRLGFPEPEPVIFLRLLGMAYVALVLGYALGLRSELRGQYPEPVVWVGILSNGGACAILCTGAFTGAWSAWGPFASVFMWASLAGTGAIAIGLLRYGVFGRRAERDRAEAPGRDAPEPSSP